jgi:aconitate hydratase
VGEDVAGAGSRVVTDYYTRAGLLKYLDALRFNVVGYGCTTCIGNSGPLPTDVSKAIEEHGLVAVSVLSGNRNFEGRISPEVRANYLMSPPLVVAYALAGHISHDFEKDSLGRGKDGKPVYLKDIWPTQKEVSDTVASCIDSRCSDAVCDGERWRCELAAPEVSGGETYGWEADSTYIRKAPYFDGMPATPAEVKDIRMRGCWRCWAIR